MPLVSLARTNIEPGMKLPAAPELGADTDALTRRLEA
jgi:hypothetical protein